MGRVGALDRPLHHGTGRPFRQSLHHKVVTVEMLAGNRKEAIAGLEGPGIRAYARKLYVDRVGRLRTYDPGQGADSQILHSSSSTYAIKGVRSVPSNAARKYMPATEINQVAHARSLLRSPKRGTIPWMKVRTVIKMIEEDGWFIVRTKGSHRQFKHKDKPGLVTIAGKLSDELAPGTLNSVLRQAGLK